MLYDGKMVILIHITLEVQTYNIRCDFYKSLAGTNFLLGNLTNLHLDNEKIINVRLECNKNE